VTASIEFLSDLHAISKEYSDRDGLDRYFSDDLFADVLHYGKIHKTSSAKRLFIFAKSR
jgi:hypothetical protein